MTQQAHSVNSLEFLLQQKISELQTTIAEYKSDKKDLLKELKELTNVHNELRVTHNTIAKTHEQELSGVEQNKKTFVRELSDLIKDKDAMGNIMDAYALAKGEPRSGQNHQIEGAESEDVQAMKTLFGKLGHEHQKMFLNQIYIYSKRPDLLEKQAVELEQIINKA